LALIYVLSIGPSIALEKKKILSKASFEWVYSPLEKAAKKVPSADTILKAYVHWWEREDHHK